MEQYNYYDAVQSDIEQYMLDTDFNEYSSCYNFDNFMEQLENRLFVCDSVTGNASGSYTFNAWEAEENICHNLELLGEALEAFDCGPDYIMNNGPEACDVTIRCYLLSQVLSDMSDDIENAWNKYMEENDNVL